MAYTLQAIVGKEDVLGPLLEPKQVVTLTQSMLLLPLTDRFRVEHGKIPCLPFGDDDVIDLIPESLATLCCRLSARGRIAYVEAEYFGGLGTQAVILAECGKIARGPEIHTSAINVGLDFVGVVKHADRDLFDTLGLGKHRWTEEWLGPSR